MKREARILVSSCKGEICVALVARGPGIDGFLASCRGCQGICSKAREEGYMGELRYHHGPCSCGLPQYPGSKPGLQEFLDSVIRAMEGLAAGGPPCSSNGLDR